MDAILKQEIQQLIDRPSLDQWRAFLADESKTRHLGGIQWSNLVFNIDEVAGDNQSVREELDHALTSYARNDLNVQQNNLNALQYMFANEPELQERIMTGILEVSPSVLFEIKRDTSWSMLYWILTLRKTTLVIFLQNICMQQDQSFKTRLQSLQLKGLIQKAMLLDEKYETAYIDALIAFLQALHIDAEQEADPIHIAIEGGRFEIVELLLDNYPMMVTLPRGKADGPSVLQTLKAREGKEGRGEKVMKDLLVGRIFKLQNSAMIRKLYYDVEYPDRVHVMDLSFFENDDFDYSEFLRKLAQTKDSINNDPRHRDPFENIKLAPVLLYLRIPELKKGSLEERTRTLSRTFEYLNLRGVLRIHELVIPNTRTEPYKEDEIATMLARFEKITIFNWIRPDISLDIFRRFTPSKRPSRLPVDNSETIAPFEMIKGVEELYLYTSKWGMLTYWASEEGLEYRYDITTVWVTIIENQVSSRNDQILRALDYKNKAQLKFEALKLRRREDDLDLQAYVDIDNWDEQDDTTLDRKGQVVQGHEARKLLGLSPGILDTYVSLSLFYDRSVASFASRVAILDTGIDITHDLIQKNVEKARSFVDTADSDRESPYWLPSSHHGHQMACLVRSIDPQCRLYIAKVGTDQAQNINPLYIRKAIEWAVQCNVDIISLSLTFSGKNQDLEDLFKEVAQKGIMVFCSTDEGETDREVYPAAWSNSGLSVSISACNAKFRPDSYTVTGASYFLPGENINVELVSYLRSDRSFESGSSVATALAAGLGSLALSCLNYGRVKGGQEILKGTSRAEKIDRVFQQMLKRDKDGKIIDKCLHPSQVFDERRARQARIERRGQGPSVLDDTRTTRADWDDFIRTQFRLGGDIHGP